ALLKSLCHSKETFLRSQKIFRNAQQKKTGPQFGHELGAYVTGLPDICAYLASRQLPSTSWMWTALGKHEAEETFKKHLFIDTPHLSANTSLTTGHTKSRRAFRMQSDEGFGANNRETSELKYAIFFWTFSTITGKNPAKQQEYVEEHALSLESFSALVKKINECSASLTTCLQSEASTLRPLTKSNATSTPQRTLRRPPRVVNVRVNDEGTCVFL
ncbi:hypothetical protein H0H93_015652, partial [Arthromyces matolae]